MNKKNLLLTGQPGIGKTTLVRNLYQQLTEFRVAGFFTSEIREKGIRKGFHISSFDGHERILAHKDYPARQKVGSYSVDLSALEEMLFRLKNLKPLPDIWLIDEIGKMALLSRRFKERVISCLDRGTVLATIVKNSSDPFVVALKARPDVTLLELTRANREQMASRLLAMLQGCCG